MAQFPIYRQQTVAQGPRASAAEFGGQVGQAMTQVGNTLTDIGVNMKRREDTIDRTMKARDFDAFAQEAARGMEPQDFARQETYDTYVQGLRAKSDELLANHRGTSASRAEFKNQLMNQVYQYEKSARETQVKAQQTIIGNIIEERTNQLAVDAGFAPDQMQSIFDELSATIDQFGDAMPPAVLEQYKNSGRSAIAATSIEQLMARGQIEAAEAVLKDPNVNKFLKPDATRRFTINIGAERGKQAKTQQDVDNRVSRMKAIMPNMTFDQEMMIRNMPPKSDRTPMDDLADWSMLNPGKAVPQSFIDQAYGFANSGIGSDWGNSIDGKAYSTLQKLADRYAMGMTTPEEDRQWQIATNILKSPKQSTDLMGKPVTIPGSVPNFVNQAQGMRRGAPPNTVPPVPMGSAAPAADGGMGMGVDNSVVDSQGRTDFMATPPQPGDANFQGGAADAAGAGGRVYESAQMAGGAGLTSSMSAMELAPYITGLSAKGAQLLGSTPGRPFPVDPRFREAQSRMDVIHDRASNALRPEGKIADQYRQELNKITALRGQAWDNDENYWQHVTGLDQTWRKIVKELDEIASGDKVSSATGAREAADLANSLQFIIREFNVPQVRVYTREQLEKLPPGTPVFIGESFKPNYRK